MQYRLIRSILISRDFVYSLFVFVGLLVFLPNQIDLTLAKDIYEVGISVLSIIFSVYFAALAFIMSSGDDDFIRFLESKNKRYTFIISTFKYSLKVLFFALILSILFYITSSVQIQLDTSGQNKFYLALFCFVFLYSLSVALAATLDSIRYALSRAEFLDIMNRINNEKDNSGNDDVDNH